MTRFQSVDDAIAWADRRDKPTPKLRLCPSEEEEQIALVARIRLHEYRYPDLQLFFHVKNEGTTWSKKELKKAMAMGVRVGMPDFVLLCPARQYHGWAAELKAMDGKPTKDQIRVIRLLQERGYHANFYYGQDAAWESLMWYLGGKVTER